MPKIVAMRARYVLRKQAIGDTLGQAISPIKSKIRDLMQYEFDKGLWSWARLSKLRGRARVRGVMPLRQLTMHLGKPTTQSLASI